jgi:hypothetical protein
VIPVVLGWQELWRRPIAFRNDFCVHCQAERVAVQVRSFYFGHLYRMPFLPLFYWRRWLCARCGENPHELSTFRIFKTWLSILIGLLAALAWYVTPEPEASSRVWWFRFLLTSAFLGVVWWATVGHSRHPLLRESLPCLVPYNSRECPLCGAPLGGESANRCRTCSISRRLVRT